MHREIVRCDRCGRKLTDPVSKSRRYGHACWEKINQEPDLIFLLNQGVEETEYDRYRKLLNKQIQKELQKVVV